MNLTDRIDILVRLKAYLESGDEQWREIMQKAYYENAWFLPHFIDMAVKNIARQYLDPLVLQKAAGEYGIPENISDLPGYHPKTIGIVMAGNIPLVGFHDFCCSFLTGHKQIIKLSSKDRVLLRHLAEQMALWNPEVSSLVKFSEQLRGCDAYIATGSNNTARYFHQYFSKWPHIIRKNRTSVAILDGKETPEELDLLADDIQVYFGLGCRNVTQVWVPRGYDFTPLLGALKKYDYLADSHKYKHNYDYVLTINMMNNTAYMTNGSIVLSPGESPYSGISNLYYAYYDHIEEVTGKLNPEEIQVIAGHGHTPFGQSQCPSFTDFADGVDTLSFLTNLLKNADKFTAA
jgi:Acyl-CoA reductase (LuxC)